MTQFVTALRQFWSICTTFDETAPYYKLHAVGMQQTLQYNPHN